jgi:hypothetical protein
LPLTSGMIVRSAWRQLLWPKIERRARESEHGNQSTTIRT